jgi:hypothetical protein
MARFEGKCLSAKVMQIHTQSKEGERQISTKRFKHYKMAAYYFDW